jgi:ketosteroid isomerase-like protein
MSRENVEVVRRWLSAFDNDTDTFRQVTHPEIEWMPFEDNHTASYGLDGAMRIRNGWLEAWDEHRLEIEDTLDGGGDDVVATVHVIGRGRGSGVEVDTRLYGHLKVRDGMVVYLYEHENRADAFKAVGLTCP